jgi:hypothetical protein
MGHIFRDPSTTRLSSAIRRVTRRFALQDIDDEIAYFQWLGATRQVAKNLTKIARRCLAQVVAAGPAVGAQDDRIRR